MSARAAYGAVAEIAPDTTPDDDIGTSETYGPDAADNALRRTADRLWRVSAYQPWAIMELGSLETARAKAPGQDLTYGERLLAIKTFTPDDLARLQQGAVTYEVLRAEKSEALTNLRTDLATTHPDAIPWLDGERAAERLGVAAMALTAGALFGSLLLLIAGAVVLTQLALVLLTVFGPFFLLLGIVPGRGRLMTVRWLELFVATAIKRVLFGIVLATVLVLSVVLLGASASLGWGVAVALEIGLVACVVIYRKAFMSLFTASRGPATAIASHAGAPRPAAAGVPSAARTARAGSPPNRPTDRGARRQPEPDDTRRPGRDGAEVGEDRPPAHRVEHGSSAGSSTGSGAGSGTGSSPGPGSGAGGGG